MRTIPISRMFGSVAVGTRPGQRDFLKKVHSFWMRLAHCGARRQRRLRLSESLPLGDRRFVAVIEFENSRFLLGGTSASLVLLARLEDSRGKTFSDNTTQQVAASQQEEGR